MPKDDMIDDIIKYLEETEKLEEAAKLERAVSDRIMTNKGYRLNKKQLSGNLKKIKRELTMRPNILGVDFGIPPEKFGIYLETERHLYVPKYYGLNKFGSPKKDELVSGKEVSLEFKGKLRDYQEVAINKVKNAFNNVGGGMLSMGCGTGKCFAPGTKIMKSDFSMELVENLKIGDKLMGDDGKERTILELGNGSDVMYNVYNKISNVFYQVNSEHILCLKKANNPKIYEMTVQNYFLLPKSEQESLCGYKPIFNFGSGKSDEFLTKYTRFNVYLDEQNDIELSSYIRTFQNKEIMHFFYRNLVRFHDLFSENMMPLTEMVLSLVGIYFNRNKNMENYFQIYNYIWEMNNKAFDTTDINKNNNLLRIIEHENDNSNTTSYDISVTKLNSGSYYGFVIDGNHRFLLGDGSVTHNTVCALNLITQMKTRTLVIVNKEFLLSQWIERIEEYTDARIGIIQQKKCEIEDKDIIVGMLQTLSSKVYESGTFNSIGLVIFDEAHHISTKVFSRCLHQVTSKYMLGLSATPKRKDGLEMVFEYFIGPMIHELKSENPNKVKVQIASHRSNSDYYTPLKIGSYAPNGKQAYNIAGMINNIAEFEIRTKFICNKIVDLAAEQRCILVLSDRREHLKAMKDIVDKSGLECGLYLGAMKQSELKKSEEAQVLFATYGLVEEAFDLPKLNTLIFASPRTSIEQAIGRILRKQHAVSPLIFDIADQFANFSNQANTRRRYYKKKDYEIWDSNFYDGEQVDGWVLQDGARRKKNIMAASSSASSSTLPKKSKPGSLLDIAIAKATVAKTEAEELAIEAILSQDKKAKKSKKKLSLNQAGSSSGANGLDFSNKYYSSTKQTKISSYKTKEPKAPQECVLELSD